MNSDHRRRHAFSLSGENRNSELRSKQVEILTIGGNNGCSVASCGKSINASFWKVPALVYGPSAAWRIVESEGQPNLTRLSYRDAMEAIRRDLIVKALARSKGNRAVAAKSLGLHKKYFLRLIKTLGIS